MKKEMEQHGGEGYGWLYGLVAGFSVAAMQIGMGLLQMERDYAVLLGAAQGILVCSLTVICGGILAWLLRPLPQEEQDRPPFPAMNRVQEYRSAFRNLARSFSGGEAGQEPPAELDGAARMNLLWNTRLQENRAAVALQLNEMADIMTDTVEHAWETQTDGELEDFLEKRLRGMGLSLFGVGIPGGTPKAGGVSDRQYQKETLRVREGDRRRLIEADEKGHDAGQGQQGLCGK